MTKRWWVLAAVACGTFMATLDSSIVNIALPTLTKSLSTQLYKVKWVVVGYLLIITCLLLPFGRLSDLYGRKRVFSLGFLVFSVGSLLCGLSQTLDWLVAARVLQGAGASMLMANGPAIITAAFGPGERGKALGVLSMVTSAGLVSGPSIGGFLIATLGWRSIFLVNLPIGLLGVAMVRQHVPRDHKIDIRKPFDWAGAVIGVLWLITFMGLIDPPRIVIAGAIPFEITRTMMGTALLALTVLFHLVERQVPAPMLDLSLLKIHTFWAANLAAFLLFVAYSSVSVLLPFFMEEVLHFSPEKTGLFMTAIPLTVLFVAPLSGHLSDRYGGRWLAVSGAAVASLGFFLMAGALGDGFYHESRALGVIMGLCSVGLATGLFQSPNNNTIMSSVPMDKLGVGSALLATVRNLGLVVGTGMATQIFTWRQRVSGDFVHALHYALYFAGIVALGAMLVSLFRAKEMYGLETASS